ncbi:MAG: Fe-S cluster assembly protein SufD [Alphaproteobacteria bacterium]|nr:Fe-S cluster assembly protein SufD [Alphaproteobacteria bacterium]
MNMQSKRPMTAAEEALVHGFARRAPDLPGDTQISEARQAFIDDIKQNGLPTRRIEAWHYTDLRSLLKTVPASEASATDGGVDALLKGAQLISLVDGTMVSQQVPDGVSCSSFRDSLDGADAARLLTVRDEDDIIGRINGAFVTDGCRLVVDDDLELSAPLEIQSVHSGGQIHTRHPITIGERSKGTFVERHLAVGSGDALVSSVTDLQVGAGADITWVISQEQGGTDTHFGQINIELGAGAKLTLFVANAGGNLVRQEIHIAAKGEGSELVLRGVNLLGAQSHTDVTMTLNHSVPDCVSSETFRNVVCDRARGVFQGQIKVAPIAQKTDARMACNTLLLSNEGDFSCKPELEIFADDVQCAHGATVTDIDDNHLFYLRARGIGEKKARALLVKAFIAEIVEELDDADLVEALEARFETWLDDHG